ncbi:phosphoadenosine phosphosulfate reductase family protein [Aliivibrio salmonicida]|uniref:phosphoadenosine phosphosulfate reductase domain-containing protein n=1 Tax=Aliivibrio salmonicida TaxID=40269 RepID=UPI0002F0CAB9
MKIGLEYDVNTAARQRINVILDGFEHFYVSFSGGKDSGVLLNLVIEESRKRNRLPVDVLIIDLEAQYKCTIEYINEMVSKNEINAFWVCLPLSLRNSVSQFQPKWICWDPGVSNKWLRDFPDSDAVIKNTDYFPFYTFGMEFEEFVLKFSKWYASIKKTKCACLVAIRSDESLNRYRTIKNNHKRKYLNYKWTTKISDDVFNAYPIYDWRVTDIWIANGKFKYLYNKIYDLMQQAGVSLAQQRLCQPFGDDQRKGLWLYQILEF